MTAKFLASRVVFQAILCALLAAPWSAFAQDTPDKDKFPGTWKLSDIKDDSGDGDRSSDLDIYSLVLTFHEEQDQMMKVDVQFLPAGDDSGEGETYNGTYIVDEATDSLTIALPLNINFLAAYAFDGDTALTLFLDSGAINSLVTLIKLVVPSLAPTFANVAPYAGVLWYVFAAATEGDATSADRADELPETAALAQNYPNPFNPSTEITWSLDESGPVRLDVFDMTGKRVATLVDAVLPQGEHAARFDAEGLSTGSYAYRLTFGRDARTLTRIMTLAR